MIREELLGIMPLHLKSMINLLTNQQLLKLQEIRLRVHQPLILLLHGEECGLNDKGIVSLTEAYRVKESDLEGLIKFISSFSLYALEDELKQGYITIEGGHRIGIVGKVVVEEARVKTIKYMSSINIRLSHEVIGCSDKILPYLLTRQRMCHTLIVSPPKCGKTTLLRDLIRNLSDGFKGFGPYTVGVVDERSEIAGCYLGVPQKNIGIRTDVLDACPKVEGMRMLLRSMAPDIIAVDEIGSLEDMLAIQEVLGAGVTIICTIHGKDIGDCNKNPILKQMLEEGRIERIILLSHHRGPCTVEAILDTTKNFKVLG